MPPCQVSAFICGWQACDLENITLCCKGGGECLCCVGEHCLDPKEPPLGPGMITKDGEICKLGLFCCSCGLKAPEVCCNSFDRCLCCSEAASFPFGEDKYVTQPHCAYCCIMCLPECGCCKPPGKDAPTMLDGTMPGGTVEGEEMKR